MRLDMSPYSSKLADRAINPALRSRCFTSNQGWAIFTPRSLASLLRAMQAPSLLDSTTTGLPFSAGRNTRSQLTYMLFTSTSANMIDLTRDLFDHVRDDTPDVDVIGLAGPDVRHIGGRRLQAQRFVPSAQAPAEELVLVNRDDHLPVVRIECPIDQREVSVVDAGLSHYRTRDAHQEGGLRIANQDLVEIKPRDA